MSIDVKCPRCGAELDAPDRAAGKTVTCPDCGDRIPVPSPSQAEPGATAEAAIQDTPAPRTAAPPEGEEVREKRP
ncbi:MAG TPA: hypothetical protein VFW33_14305, partial [Gemmataceae bacterium]|nr:hypothetical protein [Gemmataceae bacterium]